MPLEAVTTYNKARNVLIESYKNTPHWNDYVQQTKDKLNNDYLAEVERFKQQKNDMFASRSQERTAAMTQDAQQAEVTWQRLSNRIDEYSSAEVRGFDKPEIVMIEMISLMCAIANSLSEQYTTPLVKSLGHMVSDAIWSGGKEPAKPTFQEPDIGEVMLHYPDKVNHVLDHAIVEDGKVQYGGADIRADLQTDITDLLTKSPEELASNDNKLGNQLNTKQFLQQEFNFMDETLAFALKIHGFTQGADERWTKGTEVLTPAHLQQDDFKTTVRQILDKNALVQTDSNKPKPQFDDKFFEARQAVVGGGTEPDPTLGSRPR